MDHYNKNEILSSHYTYSNNKSYTINYITRSLMIYTPQQILFGWSNQEEWDGGAYSRYGGEERCIQDFGGKTWGKETNWKTQV